MVGRGNHDGVDVVAGQDFAEIVVRLAAFRAVAIIDHLGAGFAAVLERVAHGQRLAVGYAQETAEQSATLPADADVGGGDALAGGLGTKQDSRR